MASKTGQPSHELPAPKKTGTYHTGKQWKVEAGGGGRRGKTDERSTQNAPSSHHTNKWALQPTFSSPEPPFLLIRETEGSGSSNYRMSVNHGHPLEHA